MVRKTTKVVFGVSSGERNVDKATTRGNTGKYSKEEVNKG